MLLLTCLSLPGVQGENSSSFSFTYISMEKPGYKYSGNSVQLRLSITQKTEFHSSSTTMPVSAVCICMSLAWHLQVSQADFLFCSLYVYTWRVSRSLQQLKITLLAVPHKHGARRPQCFVKCSLMLLCISCTMLPNSTTMFSVRPRSDKSTWTHIYTRPQTHTAFHGIKQEQSSCINGLYKSTNKINVSLLCSEKASRYLLEIKNYGSIVTKEFIRLIWSCITDRLQVTDSLVLCKHTQGSCSTAMNCSEVKIQDCVMILLTKNNYEVMKVFA